MNNDQLFSSKSTSQTKDSLVEEPIQQARAQDSISYPPAAKVVSHSGTDASYSLVVTPTNIENTNAATQWEQIYNEGQAHHYTACPYVSVKFNLDLPNGSTWTLKNGSGTTVDTGTIKNTSIREIKMHFGMLSNGQPSLPGQSTFSLVLTDLTPGSFSNHDVDSTGGGLVIIANVDGCEEYIVPVHMTRVAASINDHQMYVEDGLK